jgi:putative chitinase
MKYTITDENGKVIDVEANVIEPDSPEVPDVTTPENQIFTSRAKVAEIFDEASDSIIDAFYDTFNEFAKEFMVTTEVQENFFLSEVVAETGRALDGKREDLNYSCSALKSTFSRYKNNPNWAQRDGRCDNHSANQVNIGNIAYADRIGNGDIDSGDGYKFRGGGYFQLTGRGNYQRMSDIIQQTIGDAIGADGLADQIINPEMATLSALAFWLDNKCYECPDIDCVTGKINYYTDTYDKRKDIYKQIAAI